MCRTEGVQTVERVSGLPVPGSGFVVPGLGFRVLLFRVFSPKFNQSTQNTKQKNTKHGTRNTKH